MKRLLYEFTLKITHILILVVNDLKFFIVIISIFVLCFGVVVQANLHPGQTFDFSLLKNIFNKAYCKFKYTPISYFNEFEIIFFPKGPVYGDLSFLDNVIFDSKIEENNRSRFHHSKSNVHTNKDSSGVSFIYLATVIYMAIVLLLVNLLIAMFR